jgi:hypothetical protein
MSWDKIKLRTAIELISIDDTDINELELIIKQLSILKDMDEWDIEKWTPSELLEEMKNWGFIKELPKPKLNKVFKYEGKEYHLCPFDKLSLAQMVDIEEYYKLGLRENLHKIMSVLFLTGSKNKLTGKIKFDEYEPDLEREEAILEQNMEFIWGNLLFFCNIEIAYMKSIEVYLKEGTMKKMMKN